jgi:membrane protein implicated in regulation of membrane protease activity
MTWSTFYLSCFVIGVTLSFLSFVGGSFRLPHFHLHLPQGHAPMHFGGGAHHAGLSQGTGFPFVNYATMTAFLAWFGGMGFLLTTYSTLMVAIVMTLATAAGLVGATMVFLFVVKLLLKHDHPLDPADYDRVGVLARISSPIRPGGTGEIIFSQGGTRQTCGARSDDGQELPRGTEVIVTRYERGLAYVRRYDEMANASGSGASGSRIL